MRQAIEARFFVGLARQLEKRQASLLSHPPTSNQQDYLLYVILDGLCERSLEEGNPVQPRPTLKTPAFPLPPVVGIASCRCLIRVLSGMGDFARVKHIGLAGAHFLVCVSRTLTNALASSVGRNRGSCMKTLNGIPCFLAPLVMLVGYVLNSHSLMFKVLQKVLKAQLTFLKFRRNV